MMMRFSSALVTKQHVRTHRIFKLNSLANALYQRFPGFYDNKLQADEALKKGCPSASLGGHERVICHIQKHPTLEPFWLIATYYLDNDINKTFRFRYYEILESDNKDNKNNEELKMKIYRTKPNSSNKLKEYKYNIRQYLPDLNNDMEYVEECDIIWKYKDEIFYGELTGDGILNSQNDPTRKIIVKDELILTKNTLSINDQIFDFQSKKQLIGNIYNIPYYLIK